VAPKIRHATYEQAPNGDAPEVRELWYLIDQPLDIGDVKDYGRGTERLAINLAETMLAALRQGLPLPSKAKLSHLFALSSRPGDHSNFNRASIRITCRFIGTPSRTKRGAPRRRCIYCIKSAERSALARRGDDGARRMWNASLSHLSAMTAHVERGGRRQSRLHGYPSPGESASFAMELAPPS